MPDRDTESELTWRGVLDPGQLSDRLVATAPVLRTPDAPRTTSAWRRKRPVPARRDAGRRRVLCKARIAISSRTDALIIYGVAHGHHLFVINIARPGIAGRIAG